MGTWGTAPWDNDTAADWFMELFATTRLAEKIEQALNLDVKRYHQRIRAAAAVLLMMGRNYVWPYDLDPHLALAISKLEEIVRLDIYAEHDGMVTAINAEIAQLKSRRESEPDEDDVLAGKLYESWKRGKRPAT